MAKTGQNPKLHKELLELQVLCDEFSRAMFSANAAYVATTERMTPRMQEAWAKYVAWCERNEDHGE